MDPKNKVDKKRSTNDMGRPKVQDFD